MKQMLLYLLLYVPLALSAQEAKNSQAVLQKETVKPQCASSWWLIWRRACLCVMLLSVRCRAIATPLIIGASAIFLYSLTRCRSVTVNISRSD